MDNKQKKHILSAVYRAITFLSLAALGWVLYLAIDKLVRNTSGDMWFDITLIAVSGLILIFMIFDAYKTRHIKNKYNLAKYLFFINFNSIVAIIVGAFVFYYYRSFTVTSEYIFAVCLLLAVEIMCIIIMCIGLTLSKLYNNTTVSVNLDSKRQILMMNYI